MAQRAVIVGAGHNGLVAASILQKSGIFCTVVEAQSSTGGACRSSIFDGQVVNWGANHLFMLSDEVLQRLQISTSDLMLKEASPEAHFLNAPRIEELVNPRDFRNYSDEVSIATDVFKKHLWCGNGSMQELSSEFRALNLKSGSLLLEGSILDVLQFYFGESEEAFGQLIAGRVLSKYGLEEPGTAISILYLAMANKAFGDWSSPRDGMQAVTDQLTGKFLADGGQLFLDTQVESANWHGDQVDSLITSQGNVISGDFFLFSGSPVEFERIFNAPVARVQSHTKNLGWGTELQDGGCSKVMLSSAKPLRFSGAPGSVLKNTMIVRSLSVTEWKLAYEDAAQFGHSRQPYFEVFGSTEFHGNTQGPFVYSIFVMYSSYTVLSELSKEQRDGLKDDLVASIVAHIENPAAIRATEVMDPVDLQAQFGLAQGNVDHGRFSVDNILENRRFDLRLLGETNVFGCGAGFFGGGLVTGMPGMLAADNILKKRGATYGE